MAMIEGRGYDGGSHSYGDIRRRPSGSRDTSAPTRWPASRRVDGVAAVSSRSRRPRRLSCFVGLAFSRAMFAEFTPISR